MIALHYPILCPRDYVWRVDGKVIEHSGFSYTPTEKDLEKQIIWDRLAWMDQQFASVETLTRPLNPG